MFEKSKLQDLQAEIDMWEKQTLLDKIGRVMISPFGAFSEEKRQKILRELKFKEKQLLEKIRFLEEQKNN